MQRRVCISGAPWRLVVGIGVSKEEEGCFSGAPVVIGSVEEEGCPKFAAPLRDW